MTSCKTPVSESRLPWANVAQGTEPESGKASEMTVEFGPTLPTTRHYPSSWAQGGSQEPAWHLLNEDLNGCLLTITPWFMRDGEDLQAGPLPLGRTTCCAHLHPPPALVPRQVPTDSPGWADGPRRKAARTPTCTLSPGPQPPGLALNLHIPPCRSHLLLQDMILP